MNDLRFLIISLIWILVAFVWAVTHASKIRQGISPGGALDYALRCFIGFALAMANAWNIPYEKGIWVWLLSLPYLAGVFWLWFDLFLNVLRGKKISYVSTTNKKLTDKIFKGSFTVQIIVKVVWITVFTALLVMI